MQCTGTIDHGRGKVTDSEREHVRICKRTHPCPKTRGRQVMDDTRHFRRNRREKKSQGRRTKIQRTRQTSEKEVQ